MHLLNISNSGLLCRRVADDAAEEGHKTVIKNRFPIIGQTPVNLIIFFRDNKHSQEFKELCKALPNSPSHSSINERSLSSDG